MFCHEPLGVGANIATLGEKGCQGIQRACKERKEEQLHVKPGHKVHTKCRSMYTNSRRIASAKRKATESTKADDVIVLRSRRPQFDYKSHCLFCGYPDIYDGRKKGHLIPVRTVDFSETIRDICRERKDDWAESVHDRITFAQNLHAMDASYHQTCSVNFRTRKDLPKSYVDTGDVSAKKNKIWTT